MSTPLSYDDAISKSSPSDLEVAWPRKCSLVEEHEKEKSLNEQLEKTAEEETGRVLPCCSRLMS